MADSHFFCFLKKPTTWLLVLFLLEIFFCVCGCVVVVVFSKCGGQKEIPSQAQSNPSPKTASLALQVARELGLQVVRGANDDRQGRRQNPSNSQWFYAPAA